MNSLPRILLYIVVTSTLLPSPNLHPSPDLAFPGETPDVKPLLRVLPAFRKEECDWAIRWDVCLRCVSNRYRYAQRIHFYPSGQYREHGCYSEERGFFLINEE
ncbi:hypothetical protein [Leptospira sarikeiensis]|uniref:Uncharacterized protein n=1 Tax=Leptospira sarikeiensis TaxID=2484943 RepID=A0A4R9K3E5_9LEPT|nr:hypothetical protein [Leptospira sarikeiensis]TGL58848.1 hypothetical protein EHQ64_17550 [Leptospira sarikeiensis]